MNQNIKPLSMCTISNTLHKIGTD